VTRVSAGSWTARRALAVCGCVLMVGLLSACGSDDSGGGGSTDGGGGAATSAASKDVQTAKAFLAKVASGKSATPLPDSAPTPKQGVSVWFISCGEAASGCNWATKGVSAGVDMLKKYGWTFHLFDAKLDPSRYGQGIQQAIVAKADVIILGAIDCGGVKPQLQAAKKAGIVTIGLQAFDCGDETQGGTSDVYTHTTDQGTGDLPADVQSWGAVQAAWSVVHTNGDVKALLFTNDQNAVTTYFARGAKAYLQDQCETCKIVQEVPFLLADLTGPPLTQKANSALLRHPDANIAISPYDPVAVPVATALVNARKADKVASIASLGVPANATLIAGNRGQMADVGIDLQWTGFESVDDAVRLTAGEQPVNGGFSVGILDKSNAKAGQFYKAPVDYEANYRKIWNAG
jgi:ribose transport system substrate-binding protein